MLNQHHFLKMSDAHFFDCVGDQQVPSTSREIKKEKGEVDLIDLINDLQNKFVASGHTLDVPLPQIIVVGRQSAGKSSVLESFVGREFLPRGRNTVTRRPTYVQMFPSHEEYVIFAHKPEAKFTDFNEVRREIEEETNRHPGPCGFSSDPISLKIYSPNVLKLTVVDLPGLIRGVEDGQDSSNINEIRNMVLQYIRPKEALILAVTPATQEIVTSDAMEIAKEVDPKRERTIGVITKIDELSEGTDCLDVLQNSRIFLQKGYFGVINRNQLQINEGKDFNYILQKEKEYFANHPAYRHMKDKIGTPYLKKMLQKILRIHIKQYLPKKRSEISAQLTDYRRSLRDFEKKMGESLAGGKQYYIIKLVQSFIKRVNIDVYGNSDLVDLENVSAGAMINFKLATEVTRNLTLSLIPDEDQASLIILNMLGLRTHVALPASAIEAINCILLEKYKAPMEESVDCIKQVLEYSISKCAKMMDRYNTLKEEVIFKINECIKKEAVNTKDRLLAHVDANEFFINFYHPDFNSTACDDLAPLTAPMKLWENVSDETPVENSEETELPVGIPSKKEMMTILKKTDSFQKNVKYSSTLLMEILKHAQKQMLDLAIKYIPNFLVKKVLHFITEDLLPTILHSTNFHSITEDCDAEFRWKEETENICKVLEEALQAIQEF